MEGYLTKSDFKKLICSDDTTTRKQFMIAFSDKIEKFVDKIFDTYHVFKKIDQKCKGDKRRSFTAAFFYNALNSLIVSFNLLISGYLVPSGNLMRHFAESLATALLVSSEELNVLERVENNQFPVHRSLDWINRKKVASKLQINKKRLEKFRQVIKNNYNDYSHASLFSLANVFYFDQNATVLGAVYDPGKKKGYEIEIEQRLRAIASLKNAMEEYIRRLK